MSCSANHGIGAAVARALAARGAAVALTEMALAGNIGLTMTVVPQIPNVGAILFGAEADAKIEEYFSEQPARE